MMLSNAGGDETRRTGGAAAGFSWTPAQQKAIGMWGSDILVSAGAGAGKTAVLVERVIQAVTREEDPLEVDRLLVVTFTDAAAEQMRDRIGRALEKVIDERPDSEDLRRQLGLLPKASISTLHSFCLEVVRQYFHRVGLDPGFRIIDDNESLILQHEALDTLLEERFDSPDDYPGFAALAEGYGGEDGRGLEQLVTALHRQFVTHPFPEEWLSGLLEPFTASDSGGGHGDAGAEGAAGGTDGRGAGGAGGGAGGRAGGADPGNTGDGGMGPLLEALAEAAALSLEKAAWLLRRAAFLAASPGGPGAYLDMIQEEYAHIAALQEAIADGGIGFDGIAKRIDGITFRRLPAVRKGEADDELKARVSSLRNTAKDAVKEAAVIFLTRPLADHLAGMASLREPVKALIHLVADYDRIFREVKAAAGGIDFSDIERYCLDLLIESGPGQAGGTGEPEASAAPGGAGGGESGNFPDGSAPGGSDGSAAGSTTEGGAASGITPPGSVIPSPLARELREKFDAVIVDEYQDINPTQETILTLVSRDGGPEGPPNRFMVGDVKQSIYRFRLAEPNIFLEKYERYPRDPAGGRCLIDLQKNFRSRANILHGVNFIFRQLFAAPAGELGYPPEAHLTYGADYDETAGPGDGPDGVPTDPPIEVHILEKSNDRLQEAINSMDPEVPETETARRAFRLVPEEREAVLTARRVKELMEEFRVWDGAAKTYRPLSYGDIAILMRAPRHRAPVYTEVFRRYGIPVSAQMTTGYFDAMEVMTVLALLRVMDNPQQDIQLAAALASPMVGLAPAELLSIRLAARYRNFYEAAVIRSREDDGTGKKLRRFLDRLERWRTMVRRGRLAHVLWAIYQETGYLEYVMGLPDGDQRRTNLLALHQRAREFDGFGRRGLFRFLRFIDGLREKDGDQGQPVPTDATDAVQLMSIHKSKGLEFPVVFLCQAGSGFNRGDTSGRLLTHRDLGLGPEIVDTELGIRYPSLAHHALRHRLTAETLAEEMRVLYVAMTRAKERLIIIGSADKLEDKCAEAADFALQEEEPLHSSFLHSAATPLDWIMAALSRHGTAGQPMRRHAPGPAGSAPPANKELAEDGSRWKVDLWDDHRVLTLTLPRFDGGGAALPWDDMAEARPLPEGLTEPGKPPRPGKPPGPGKSAESEEPGRTGPDDGYKYGAPSSGGDGAALPSAGDGAAALAGSSDPSLSAGASGAGAEEKEDLTALLEARLGWESPWMPLSRLAARAAVTEVKRGHDLERTAVEGEEEPAAPLVPPEGFDAEPADAQGEDGGRRRETGPPRIPLRRPRFLQDAGTVSPVERGSATHALMERIRLVPDMSMEHLQQELGRLTEAGLIPPDHAEAIDLMSVFWFFQSPLGRRLTSAPWVKRELAFGMKVPAANVYSGAEVLKIPSIDDEWVMVQGIIDCLFEDDGGFVLIDFKTDRVGETAVENAARWYENQIRTYCDAAAKLYGKPVDEAFLFFLTPSVAHPMDISGPGGN